MADLFLHLPFARRLRFADGLHPLAGEAIGRRPSLVVLGASLACLPENERRGMSWFRRLFSGGGEAARWQKLLAAVPGQPPLDVLVSLLSAEDAALGPMGRLAIGLGVLSHAVLEEKIGALSSSLQGSDRAAVERAQARLWLQSAVPGHLENEWKPALELADAESGTVRRATQHVDRALKRVHGSGPGEPALSRWLKGLAVELGPLAEGRGASGALPPALSISDHDARGPHFEQVAFVEKTQAAIAFIVGVANRLGEAFTKGSPDRATVTDAVAKLAEPKSSDIETARVRWKEWLNGAKDAALTRGRNPKPAFTEGELIAQEHKLAGLTGVMKLSDLPPEAQDALGAPPLPEQSGPMPPSQPPDPPPSEAAPPGPNITQDLSQSQIEAESAQFQAPAHTQEVSVAQIESLVPVPDPPLEQKITQPISAADIAAANAVDAPVEAAPVPPTAPPASAEEAAVAAPTPPDAPVEHAANGANGAAHPDPAATPATAPVEPARPEDPPRE